MSSDDRTDPEYRRLNAVTRHHDLLLAPLLAAQGVSLLADTAFTLDRALGYAFLAASTIVGFSWAISRRGSTRPRLASASIYLGIVLIIMSLMITKWVSD
jgi:hypothetical protein